MTWGVTTVDDCYGYPEGTLTASPLWCVYDMEEDDPPIAERLSRGQADYICDALNLYDQTRAEVHDRQLPEELEW